MARIRWQLRPLVGVPRAELAEVWPEYAGGSLRGAAEGAPPPAPPHHLLPKCHHDGGEAAVRPGQPGWSFQALWSPSALFRPIYSRYEEDYWLLNTYCRPGTAGQEFQRTTTGLSTQMMIVEGYPSYQMGSGGWSWGKYWECTPTELWRALLNCGEPYWTVESSGDTRALSAEHFSRMLAEFSGDNVWTHWLM